MIILIITLTITKIMIIILIVTFIVFSEWHLTLCVAAVNFV